MTRVMYDAIYPANAPAGAQLYAAYLDGTWADYPAMVARFPGAVHVSISVTASLNAGQVLDVENGDATATESVDWVLERRAAGVDPTVYCSMSAWASVQTAFRGRGVEPPHYWIADYSLGSNPAIPAGAVALQYTDKGGYDISIVADYWPGVDPTPTPPTQETDMPYLISVTPDPTDATNKGAGVFTVDAGKVVHVDPGSFANLQARFGAPVVVTPAYYAALTAQALPGTVVVPTAEQNAQATVDLIDADLKS